MAQLTLQPTGYGNFYGDSYGGDYAYCVGTQQQYDDLADWQKATIKAGYTTGVEVHNALAGATQTEPIVVYVLDASTDVSMIQSSYNGQPVTIDMSFLPKASAQRKFGYGFGFQF